MESWFGGQLIPESRAETPHLRTGRAVTRRRKRVDEVPSLDITDLHKATLLDQAFGTSGVLSWTGQFGAGISLKCGVYRGRSTDRCVMLEGSADSRVWRQVLDITTTPCRFGGRRFWFVGPVNACCRRCRIVYLVTGQAGALQFQCRRCAGLTYESRQRHRSRRYEQYLKPMKVLKRLRTRRVRTREEATQALLEARHACAAVRQYEEARLGRLCGALETLLVRSGGELPGRPA